MFRQLLAFFVGLVIVAVLIISSGCGGDATLVSPSNSTTAPPDSAPTKRATAWYKIYGGDCSATPASSASCDGRPELFPTQDPTLQLEIDTAMYGTLKVPTYIVPNHRGKQTVHLCVEHPGITGRRIIMGMVVSPDVVVGFDFLEETSSTPVCIATAFDMTIGGGPGVLNTKSGGLVELKEEVLGLSPTEWTKRFGFRVSGLR